MKIKFGNFLKVFYVHEFYEPHHDNLVYRKDEFFIAIQTIKFILSKEEADKRYSSNGVKHILNDGNYCFIKLNEASYWCELPVEDLLLLLQE